MKGFNPFSRIENRARAYIGLILAAVAFLAVNVLASEALYGVRADLTERKLFTISEGTRQVLDSIDEPILLRLFFSRELGERNADYANYFDRVNGLLKQYVAMSDGKLRLELHRPEPFSREEDRALAYSLTGTPVNAAGEPGYFGLVAINSTDGQGTIPFFSLDRENFLEYDLTRLIHTMVNPEKPVVGVISTLPVHGRHAPPYGTTPRWPVMSQLDALFEIYPIDVDAREIPKEIDLLMIVQPTRMTRQSLYAIDQFVMNGGRAVIFVDPFAEAQSITSRTGKESGNEDINLLLARWGVAMVPDKLAADLDAARRINTPVEGRLQVLDYVVWLGLEPKNFNRRDPVTASMSRINLATVGILERVRGAKTEITPLMSTGTRTMRIDVAKVARADPDVIGMFRDFKPSGDAMMLAARITGNAESAFDDGPPPGMPDGAAARHLSRAKKPLDVIVVADTDILFDKFWAEMRVEGDQPVAIPFANNADFLVNALETLSGDEKLVGLRGRRESSRPFLYVDQIRREAERQYRSKEKELIARIQQTQAELNSLVSREGAISGTEVLSDRDRGRIDALRHDVVTMRQDLRQVQHALRADIERLDGWLKFLNIGAVPIVLGLLTVLVLVMRRFGQRKVAR